MGFVLHVRIRETSGINYPGAYCLVRTSMKSHQTNICQSATPIFNDEFTYQVNDPTSGTITVKVMERNNDLAKNSIKLTSFPPNQIVDQWYDLNPCSPAVNCPKIHLIFQMIPNQYYPPNVSPAQPGVQYPPNGNYPPNGYNQQGGYDQQNGYYPPNGYNQQGGYYPPNGYDQQGGYYPPNGYNQQGGYDQQNGYYPPNGYPQQGYYPENGYNQQGGYDQQNGYYPPNGYPQQGYNPYNGYHQQGGYDQGGYPSTYTFNKDSTPEKVTTSQNSRGYRKLQIP